MEKPISPLQTSFTISQISEVLLKVLNKQNKKSNTGKKQKYTHTHVYVYVHCVHT